MEHINSELLTFVIGGGLASLAALVVLNRIALVLDAHRRRRLAHAYLEAHREREVTVLHNPGV